MKKLILLTFGILMTSNMALACGGVTVKGKSGTSYCVSKHTMNWYSASAWCQNQKMQLLDIKAICGCINCMCSELAVSADEQTNLKSNGIQSPFEMWTNTSAYHDYAYVVSLSNGNIGTLYGTNFGNRATATRTRALCK